MKVIALIRTSTDRQRRDEQKKEVIEVIKADGYMDDQIIVVGDKCGASAIKIDDQYLENMQKIYNLVETGEIEAVYAWAIDRIGRDRTQLNQFRETLVNNHVQLVIKNPSLRLLNPDGTENSGVGLAFALFAEMAVQEMQQKKARFHKGRKDNAQIGKYNGGYITFGYEIDKDGFYVVKESEAEVVRNTFEMMASDKYSINTLTEELRSRGIMFHGRLINYQMVLGILKNTAYIGYRDKYVFNHKYPRIISDELYNKTQEVMKSNNCTKSKATKHYTFANLLIKCPECGRSYIANMSKDNYRCSAHSAPKYRKAMGEELCNNDLTISMKHIDGILWEISTKLYYKYIKGLDVEKKAEIESEISSLNLKIKESPNLLKEVQERYERVDEVYMTGRMTKEKYASQISSIQKEENEINGKILGWKEEVKRLNEMLRSDNNMVPKWLKDISLLTSFKIEVNEEKMYDLVHKYIKDVSVERATLPSGSILSSSHGVSNKDIDFSGKACVKVVVTSFDGEKTVIYFLPMTNYKQKSYQIIDSKFVPFIYEPVVRENNRSLLPSIELRKELFTKYAQWWNNTTEDRISAYNYICLDDNYSNPSKEVQELKELMLRLKDMLNYNDTLYTDTVSYIALNFKPTEEDKKKITPTYPEEQIEAF